MGNFHKKHSQLNNVCLCSVCRNLVSYIFPLLLEKIIYLFVENGSCELIENLIYFCTLYMKKSNYDWMWKEWPPFPGFLCWNMTAQNMPLKKGLPWNLEYGDIFLMLNYHIVVLMGKTMLESSTHHSVWLTLKTDSILLILYTDHQNS